MAPTVKARARDRCELRLLGVCTYWGKEFYEIVSPPETIEDLLYVCPGCGAHVRNNAEWAQEKGLLNRPL
jgi:hypothetical protein